MAKTKRIKTAREAGEAEMAEVNARLDRMAVKIDKQSASLAEAVEALRARLFFLANENMDLKRRIVRLRYVLRKYDWSDKHLDMAEEGKIDG